MRVQRLARGAASVVVAAAILLASAAGAQSFWDDTLTYEQGLAATRRAHDRDQMSLQPRLPPARRALYREPPSTQQRCGRGDMGSILGAIAGGLLGSAPADRHGSHPAGVGRGEYSGRDCD